MNKKARENQKKRKFCYIAIPILGFITISYYWISTYLNLSRIKRSVPTIKVLALGIVSYQSRNGHYPITTRNEILFKSLDTVIKFKSNSQKVREENDGDKILVDRWGTPFKYISEDGSTFLLISAGPDKIFNTKDDFWVTDKEEGRGKAPSLREGKTQKE